MMNLFGKSGKKTIDPFEPIPTGEVVEGNQDSDWAAWEDSVAFQDSQMPEFQVTAVLPVVKNSASATPPPAAEDAFASVSKNSG